MLLYLDIDGVMVPANSWRKPEILEDGFPEFSINAVKSLDRIISTSSAITRLPKNVNHLNRKEELINWFSSKKINEKFIIIDDDKSLNGLPDFLKDKLIQTSGSVGLTEYLAEEALDIINNLEYKLVK